MTFSPNLLLFSLLAPPASCLWLSLTGLALLRSRFRRWGRVLVGLGLGSLYLFSTGLCAGWLAAGLEPTALPAPGSPQLTARLRGWQAIVVLGAGRTVGAPEYGGADIPSYWAASRLRYGANLYRQTGLPLLVSGGSVAGETEPEATLMARSLERDYLANVRWQEGKSRTTWENARNSADLLKAQGVSRIVLVTSAVHMRRSVAAFEHFGFTVQPAATDYSDFGHLPLMLRLVPNAVALLYTQQALHEYVGVGWYRVRALVE
jgi:uncharacterized SAM-binding protein YcdF (DUF218 family)